MKHTNSEKLNDFIIYYLKNSILNTRKKSNLYNIVSTEYNKLEKSMVKQINMYHRRIEQIGSEVKELIVHQNSMSKGLDELYSHRVNEKMMMINDLRMNRELLQDNVDNAEILNKKYLYSKQIELRDTLIDNEKNPKELIYVVHKLIKQVIFNNDEIKVIFDLENFMTDYLSIPLSYEVIINRDFIVWNNRYDIKINNQYKVLGQLKRDYRKR